MMDFSPIKILQKAQKDGYVVGQFNVSNLEQIRAVCETGAALRSPIILGTSEGERKFIGLAQIVGIVKTWQEETGLPIILNADHSRSFGSAKEAFDSGYTSIHFDGSELPYEENLKITKQVVEYVKLKNPEAIVEGELGRIPGGSQVHTEVIALEESDFTDTGLAAEFVKETRVDSLAISFGNIHGMFGKGLEAAEKLNIERLKAIRQKTDAFLVLHGGSGISALEIREAIKNGIVKININTELRVAYVNTLRAILNQSTETTPYKIWPPAIEAVKKVVEEKIKLFGSEGRYNIQ
jgi:fructose-bisphosphate aldolase class II